MLRPWLNAMTSRGVEPQRVSLSYLVSHCGTLTEYVLKLSLQYFVWALEVKLVDIFGSVVTIREGFTLLRLSFKRILPDDFQGLVTWVAGVPHCFSHVVSLSGYVDGDVRHGLRPWNALAAMIRPCCHDLLERVAPHCSTCVLLPALSHGKPWLPGAVVARLWVSGGWFGCRGAWVNHTDVDQIHNSIVTKWNNWWAVQLPGVDLLSSVSR